MHSPAAKFSGFSLSSFLFSPQAPRLCLHSATAFLSSPLGACLPRSGPRLVIHRYILNFDGAQLTLEPSKLGLQWVNEALGHKQYGAHPEKAGTGKFVLSVACWNPGGKLLACGFVDARSFLGSEHQIVQATDDFLQA